MTSTLLAGRKTATSPSVCAGVCGNRRSCSAPMSSMIGDGPQGLVGYWRETAVPCAPANVRPWEKRSCGGHRCTDGFDPERSSARAEWLYFKYKTRDVVSNSRLSAGTELTHDMQQAVVCRRLHRLCSVSVVECWTARGARRRPCLSCLRGRSDC